MNELRRTRAVERLGMINTAPEPMLDRLVSGVSAVFDTPFALLSIVDGNRLWFKSTKGLTLTGVLRSESFCTHLLDSEDLLEVCNAAEHDLFRTLPIVCGPVGVRYYLGTRLRLSSGIGVGSLCVFDTVARPEASRDQQAYLQAMARQAEVLIEFGGHDPLEKAA